MMKPFHWKTRGSDIPFTDMSTDYLENCLHFCKKKAFYGSLHWSFKADEIRKELSKRYRTIS